MRVQFYTSYLVNNCAEVKCFVISVFKYYFSFRPIFIFNVICKLSSCYNETYYVFIPY